MADSFTYATSQVIIGALGTAAVGLSNPGIWWMMLLSVPTAILSLYSLNRKKSRVAFVIGYIVLSTISFLIGYAYYDGYQIASPGWQALCIAMVGAGIFGLSLLKYDNKSQPA